MLLQSREFASLRQLNGNSYLQMQASPDPLSGFEQKGPSQHAWLWSDPTLSDVTVVLESHDQVQDLSRSSTVPEDTASLERPFKKVCRPRSMCSCADHVPPATPGVPTPHRNTTVSEPVTEEQHSSVFEPGPSDLPLPSPHIPPAFKLHAVILSSASGYFRALFARSMTCDMGGWCPECKVTKQVLEGQELEAAEHVLRFIYTQELPTDGGLVPTGLSLLWMIQVGVCKPIGYY